MGHSRPNPSGRRDFWPHTASFLLGVSYSLIRLVVTPSLGPKFPASRPRLILLEALSTPIAGGGNKNEPGAAVVAEILAGEKLETLACLPGDGEGFVIEHFDQSVGDLDRVIVPQGFSAGDAHVKVGIGLH